MKAVVLGAAGLVGSHLVASFRAHGSDVGAVSRNPDVNQGVVGIDLRDVGMLTRYLEAAAPDVVAYAAGWSWVDGCEKDPARSLLENVELPLAVARWCASRGVRFLHFSSSYVFDGVRGGYAEDDPTNPVNVYGRHKLKAERAVLDATCGAAIIPRLVWVWGRDAGAKGYIHQIHRAAKTGSELLVAADQYGNPTWAGDIAEWAFQLCASGSAGIWHLASDGPEIGRLDWAKLILDGFGRVGLPVGVRLVGAETASLSQPARRPLRSGMCNLKVKGAFPKVCREPVDLEGIFSPDGFLLS